MRTRESVHHTGTHTESGVGLDVTNRGDPQRKLLRLFHRWLPRLELRQLCPCVFVFVFASACASVYMIEKIMIVVSIEMIMIVVSESWSRCMRTCERDHRQTEIDR